MSDLTSPRQTILRMPNELLSLIIDNIWDSKSALHSCSLINKLFSQICRPFVYRKLTIKDEQRYEETLQLLEQEPTICFWIRDLHIILRKFKPMNFGPTMDESPWHTDFLQVLPTKCPNLHTLSLVGCFFVVDGLDLPTVLLGFSRWKSLTTLTLKRCQFNTISIPEFLCCFPALTSLSLHDTADSQGVSTDRTQNTSGSPWSTIGTTPTPPALYHLSDYSLRVRKPVLSQWLLSTPSRRSLRSLSLRIQYQSGFSTDRVNSFFQEVGSRLRHLQISWAPTSRYMVTQRINKWIASNVDLSPLTALKTLRIRRPITPTLFPLLMSLPQAQQHPIHTLTLRVHVAGTNSLDQNTSTNPDLKPLDDYLALPNFPNLTKVRALVTNWRRVPVAEADSLMAGVEAQFSAVKERGILQLENRITTTTTAE